MFDFAFSVEAVNAAHHARVDGKDIREVLGAALQVELAKGRLKLGEVPRPAQTQGQVPPKK